MTEITSPKFSIDGKGMGKVWKGVLIGCAGLVLTGLEASLPFISFSDPMWASVAVMVNSTIANFARKFISEY